MTRPIICIGMLIILLATACGTSQRQEDEQNIGEQDPMELARTGVSSNDEWEPYMQVIDGVEMVLVPTGCTTGNVGSVRASLSSEESFTCIDRPYWIDRFEVTNADYGEASLGEACNSVSADPNQPRNCVDLLDAQAHCESRGGQLPTVAEAYYVSSGPDSLLYPWGPEWNPENTVWAANSEGQTSEVGSLVEGTSWVGILDIVGNVREWVSLTDEGCDSGRCGSLGGSFADTLEQFDELNLFRLRLTRGEDGEPDLGFRCVLPTEYELPEPTGKLVYLCRPEGINRKSICVLDLDTDEVSVILSLPEDELNIDYYLPHWSPDGAQIVYQVWNGSRRHLWVMNADGSDPRQLTSDDAQHWSPDWSPDGSQIAYDRFDVENSVNEIWVMDADGSNPRPLTEQQPQEDSLQEARDSFPQWSPDGRTILFHRSEWVGGVQGFWDTIWQLDLETGEESPLTSLDTQDRGATWSPDGSRIIFLRGVDVCEDGSSFTEWSLWVMNADGSGQRPLFNHDDDILVTTNWSPDGEWIVASRGLNDESELWIMRSDGTDLRQITNNERSNWSPDWYMP